MHQKSRHLGYVDFLKGFAIVSVILLHALPKKVLVETYAVFHIWQAVPLFVFISFLLIYIKLRRISVSDYYGKKNWGKLFKRIIAPFLIIEGLLLLFFAIKGNNELILQFLQNGRIGRGSYYFYVYLQIWLLAPITYLLMRWNHLLGGVILLFVSVLGNVMCFFAGLSPMLESCLALRYIFIAVIAYEWMNNSKSRTWKYLFPVISVLYLLLMDYYDFNPWIPNTGGWGHQQFPSFFYLFPFVSIMVYLYTKCNSFLSTSIRWLGQYSWEIYLIQMIFFLFPFNTYIPLGNSIIHQIVYCIISLILCILPVYAYSKVKQLYKQNENTLYNTCPWWQ